MRVMVTGASGFVGRAALDGLRARGLDVHAVCRTRPLNWPKECWTPVDLLEPRAIKPVLASIRPQAILHLAWTVEHGRFWTAPENLDWSAATLNFARAAADAGVSRFVAAGTCYEYDWPTGRDCDEAGTPIRPSTLYGITKDATRRTLDAFFRTQNVAFSWARLFFLFGPGEGPNRLVPSIARSLVAGEVAKCSQGLARRDFMDVRDCGSALAALVVSAHTGAINVASGEAATIGEIAQRLGALAGRTDLIALGALPDRAGEPLAITANVALLRQATGFVPSGTIDHKLADALGYWRGQAEGVLK